MATNNFRFPEDQDCHEMWCKERKRQARLEAQGKVVPVDNTVPVQKNIDTSVANPSNQPIGVVKENLRNYMAEHLPPPPPLPSLAPAPTGNNMKKNPLVSTKNGESGSKTLAAGVENILMPLLNVDNKSTSSAGFMTGGTYYGKGVHSSGQNTVKSATNTFDNRSSGSGSRPSRRTSVKSDIQLNHYTSKPVNLRDASASGNGSFSSKGSWS